MPSFTNEGIFYGMIILSITGLFKTLLILIGVFVLLRFIGQLMIAKRNIVEERKIKDFQNKINKEKKHIEKNSGKITISKKSSHSENYTDFEEL